MRFFRSLADRVIPSVGVTSGNYVLRINNVDVFGFNERLFRSCCGNGVGLVMVSFFLYCGPAVFRTLCVRE